MLEYKRDMQKTEKHKNQSVMRCDAERPARTV